MVNSTNRQVTGRVDRLAASVEILMASTQRHAKALAQIAGNQASDRQRSDAHFAELKDLVSRALPSPSIRKSEKLAVDHERSIARLERSTACLERVTACFERSRESSDANFESLRLMLEQGLP